MLCPISSNHLQTHRLFVVDPTPNDYNEHAFRKWSFCEFVGNISNVATKFPASSKVISAFKICANYD